MDVTAGVHLPAYLIAAWKGEYGYGMAFTLTNLDEQGRLKFELLDVEQRQAVRALLLHIRQDPDYSFDREDIDRALDNYWTPPSNLEQEATEETEDRE